MNREQRLEQLKQALAKRWGNLHWKRRAWDKVVMGDNCWYWSGAHNGLGYGQFQTGPRASRETFYSHRFVYEELRGPIPEGLELDHLCRNPGCCNPAHLEPVTHQQNMKRSKAATKMSCKRGHDWSDPYNVYIRKDGRRWCAECNRTLWTKK